MSMNKKVTIPMETTAYYQSESKLNVRFWSQDRNTAELRFLITRNDYPLSLSSENVKVFLTLKSGDSFISTDDVDIYNEVEGVVTYIIPEEFMRVANEVVGQVYVATLDEEEIVVQRKFSFTVENDLLSSIPSEEKIRYIKMFSDLQEEMSIRLGGVETALTQLETNVEEVNNAKESGITAINNLYNAKLVTFNQNFDDKMESINNAMDDMESYVDISLADMTAKKEAFDSSVSGSGLVTTGQSENWQKVKITNDDGTTPLFSNFDFNNPDYALTKTPGTYYVRGGLNSSANGISSNYGYLTISKTYSNNSVAELIYRPIGTTSLNSGEIYTCRKNTEWGSWTFVGVDPNKTETVTGSQNKANTAENNAKVYTDEKVSSLHKLLFSGNVNGVGKNIVINDDYNKYDEIRLFYSTLGGRDSKVVKAKETNQIVIYSFNLTNSDGSNGDIFETTIDRVNSTTLKISNEVRFNLLSQTGGSTAGITITDIIGVKY